MYNTKSDVGLITLAEKNIICMILCSIQNKRSSLFLNLGYVFRMFLNLGHFQFVSCFYKKSVLLKKE